MFCSKSGNSLAQGAEFCSKCGTKINQQDGASDAASTPKQHSAAEKITELSAEKWKELSPKAKEAAAIATEKASAVSKDILGELKQSSAALRQAIDENKGDGTESKAKVIEKTATSFFGMLSGKQKAILTGTAGLVVVMAFWLFSGDSDFDRLHELSCKEKKGTITLKEQMEFFQELMPRMKKKYEEKYKGSADGERAYQQKMIDLTSKGC